MHLTRTDLFRRRLMVGALVIGPVLATVSAAINVRLPSGTMREDFDTMAANASSILAQDLLEIAGFTCLLAALGAVALTLLRERGGALGTWGAVLAVAGIVGFAVANASGLVVVGLAGLPDRDAAFGMAVSLTSTGVASVAGNVGFVLEVAGQLGILAVLGGLVRARLIRLWPLLVVVAGIVLNAAGGSMTTMLAADVLLVVALTATAFALGRALRREDVATHVPQPVG